MTNVEDKPVEKPSKARMPSVTRLKLVEPLTTHGGKLTHLEIKSPKARELVKMKVSPSTYYISGKFEIHHDIMMGYLVLLTGHDEMTLEDMDASDFAEASNVVRDYLSQSGNLPNS